MLVCRAPIYPPKTGPTPKNHCLSENLYFLFSFSRILLTNSSLKSVKAVFLIEERLLRLLLYKCGSRGGDRGSGPPPGKSQVIWVSIGNKQFVPPHPPPPGTLKNDSFLWNKPFDFWRISWGQKKKKKKKTLSELFFCQIDLDPPWRKFLDPRMLYAFLPYTASISSCVLGAQKNPLIETVLLSTQNTCFGPETKKREIIYLRSFQDESVQVQWQARILTFSKHPPFWSCAPKFYIRTIAGVRRLIWAFSVATVLDYALSDVGRG